MIHWNGNGISYLNAHEREAYADTLEPDIGSGRTLTFDDSDNVWLTHSTGERVLVGEYRLPPLAS